MKNHFSIRFLALLLMGVFATNRPAVTQTEEADIQCVLSAIDDIGAGRRNSAQCAVLDHQFVVVYNAPTLSATVNGPVVNTSRSFHIPRSLSTFKADGSGAGPLLAQDERSEAIQWAISVVEQIRAGISLSASVPSTNSALNATLRTFTAIVMPNVKPQALMEQAGQAEGESETSKSAAKPGEISTDVEYESFTFVKLDGRTVSFRAAFERTTDTGGLGFGVRLSYTRVSFDQNDNRLQSGEGTAYLKIPLADFLEVGANITGTASRLKFVGSNLVSGTNELNQNVNTVGYGPFLSARVPLGNHLLAGGLLYQVTNPDDGDKNLSTLSYGAMGVFCLSEKLAISAEGFRMANLDVEGADDSFTVLHPQLHLYITSSFGLIVGYKTVVGIDDYDSTEFTLGSSIRF
jgi:hypothetical protein